MPYTKTNWIDEQTKLGPTNLNKLENGIFAAGLTFNVKDSAYGAVGDGVADDTAAVTAALAAASSAGGGIVHFPPGTYKTTGGHTVPAKTIVRGAGLNSMISHSGNNTCFLVNTGGAGDLTLAVTFEKLRIVGNSGASGIGIDIQDSASTVLRDVRIEAYTGGVGLRLHNVSFWTEQTDMLNLDLTNNAIGMQFRRETGSSASFGYTRASDFFINCQAGQMGIDVGNSGIAGIDIYNADFTGFIHLAGNNGTGIKVGAGQVWGTSRLFIRGEMVGGLTGCVGFQTVATADVNVDGYFSIDGASNSFAAPTLLGGRGLELSYTELAVGIALSGTEASPTDVLASNPIMLDGGTPIIIECFFPAWSTANAAGAVLGLNLWEDSTDLKRITQLNGQNIWTPIGTLKVKRTPAAGTHTYKVRGWQANGTGTLWAGASNIMVNGFLRITKA